MICKKCKKNIPDNSIFCLYCGHKQTKEVRKELKRANGMGSITKLPGRRRKPWLVRVSKMVNGIQERKSIGTFEKKIDAIAALEKYQSNGIPELNGISLNDVFNLWKKNHYETLTKKGIEGYNSAWSYLNSLSNRPIQELKTQHYQNIIDKAVEQNKSRAVCEKIKQLCSQLCKYAMNNDLINKNYSQFLVLPKQKESTKDKFTDEEINKIQKYIDTNKTAQIIYVLIYTGMRIDELFSVLKGKVFLSEKYNYIIGGKKTRAGKNRTIPIHPYILPIVCKWYNSATKYLICNTKGGKMNVQNFRKRDYYPFLESLNIRKLTPHCTRHTFASLGVKNGLSPQVLKEIMGHEKYETVAEIYAHTDMEQIFSEFNKMK